MRRCQVQKEVVTGLVTFSILLVHAMQYPFSGDVSIRPGRMKCGVSDEGTGSGAIEPLTGCAACCPQKSYVE